MTDNATPRPLPWPLPLDYDGDCCVHDAQHQLVVECFDSEDAAGIVWACNNAPALLSALEGLTEIADEADRRVVWESLGLGNSFAEKFEAAVEAARAAIASAKS